ncbi:MAG: signal peptide peptidase SppA [Acidobacteria bacterium]|nr:signal peptide peptidase SppA [Acidobacteriota bacterium]
MPRTGLKIFLSLVALIVLAVCAAAGFIYWKAGQGPSIEEKSVLMLKLEGDIPEYATPPLSPFEKRPLTVWEIREVLQKSAADHRIVGLWVWLNYPNTGWGKVEEIVGYIDEFQKSKKPVVAYVNAADERGYSIALACDEIFAPADAYLELNGLAVEVVHIPGLLEKLGIKVQFERFGKYKSVSGEKYGRKDLSDPVREMINSMLDSQYSTLVGHIAARRNRTREQVQEEVDKGEYFARHAIASGLIDGDKDEIQVEEHFSKKVGVTGKLSLVSASTYASVPRDVAGLKEEGARIAIIHAAGIIVQGKGGFNPIFLEHETGTDSILENLTRASEDEATKAIVLRVNSPGGAGFGPELICSKIEKVKKPVVVSMSDYAASGGYWISMAARKIVAEPSTITGSIGVWSVFPDLSGFNEKLGLTVDTLKRGKRADMLFANRPLDEEERAIYRQSVLDMYNHFVSDAARLRKMPREKMEEVAQGRSWLGHQAKANGLVDAIGSIDTAIDLAKKEAGIEGPVTVWLPARRSWIERLEQQMESNHREETTLPALAERAEELLCRLKSERLYTADPERMIIH